MQILLEQNFIYMIDNMFFIFPGDDRYDFGLGEENIESYRFGGESKPGDDRGAVSGIGIFRD